MRGRPHPRSCFFERAEFQRLLGHDLLQRAGFLAQRLNPWRARASPKNSFDQA